jgi:hypothetical protein
VKVHVPAQFIGHVALEGSDAASKEEWNLINNNMLQRILARTCGSEGSDARRQHLGCRSPGGVVLCWWLAAYRCFAVPQHRICTAT